MNMNMNMNMEENRMPKPTMNKKPNMNRKLSNMNRKLLNRNKKLKHPCQGTKAMALIRPCLRIR
jgi:hypothetical protein